MLSGGPRLNKSLHLARPGSAAPDRAIAPESVTLNGPFVAHGRILRSIYLRAGGHAPPRGLLVRVRCRRCRKRALPTTRFVSPLLLYGAFVPSTAKLELRLTRRGWIGRYLVFSDAGSAAVSTTEEDCVQANSGKLIECPESRAVKKAEAKARERSEREARETAERHAAELAQRERQERERQETREAAEREEREAKSRAERETRERGELEARRHAEQQAKELEEEEAKKREETEARERVEREAKEAQPVTSFDSTRGDLAPFEAPFTIAHQQFTAASDTITYVGAVVANPALPVGPAAGDHLRLRVCTDSECEGSGAVLASTEAPVHNYGLSAAEIGELAVTPGDSYYLVWSAPANAHANQWLAFWHSGTATIAGSSEMEAIVRGYDHEGAGEHAPRRTLISYLGTRAPPAPHAGSFTQASQSFTAASNRITKLGVVLGNPKLARLATAPEEVTIRLCQAPGCSGGTLANGTAYIVNYGVTLVDVGRVTVTPGATYFISWQAPTSIEGESWVAFWEGDGPSVSEAGSIQALARGYDEGSLKYEPTYFTEQAEQFGAPTFSDYINATEEGTSIEPGETVQVTCKLFAPEIQSAEPEGYWYRIHTKPWVDKYYAVANAFRNAPEGAEPLDSDPGVPDC